MEAYTLVLPSLAPLPHLVLLQVIPEELRAMSFSQQLMQEAVICIADTHALPDTILGVQVIGKGHAFNLVPIALSEDGAEKLRALQEECEQPNVLDLLKKVRESYERVLSTLTCTHTCTKEAAPPAEVAAPPAPPAEVAPAAPTESLTIESVWGEKKPRCSFVLKTFFDRFGK